MPFYRFLIHGKVNLNSGLKGFYTTRWCWSGGEKSAATKILELVRRDWKRGKSIPKTASIFELEIEDTWPIAPWRIFESANRGYTFYEDEG